MTSLNFDGSKGVFRLWFEQRKSERVEDVDYNTCEEFQSAFLYYFFPFKLREAKIQEFTNLRQESICVKEYALKFVRLSNYAPLLI